MLLRRRRSNIVSTSVDDDDAVANHAQRGSRGRTAACRCAVFCVFFNTIGHFDLSVDSSMTKCVLHSMCAYFKTDTNCVGYSDVAMRLLLLLMTRSRLIVFFCKKLFLCPISLDGNHSMLGPLFYHFSFTTTPFGTGSKHSKILLVIQYGSV